MIAAIYLTYNPDAEVLSCSVQSALDECDLIYIYDNASKDSLSLGIDNPRVNVINGRYNIGVAGLNILARLAIAQGAQYLMILDQDSMLPKGYAFKTAHYLEKNEAIICPIYSDRERGISSKHFDSKSFFKGSFEITPGSEEYVRTDFAIGSGMTLTAKAWDKLGGLDEKFFLDCADMDICFRASQQEIPIYLDTKSVMNHSIGEGYISVLGIKFSNHTPFRHYLYYKNMISLIFSKTPPFQWKVRSLIKILIQGGIYSMLSPQRLLNTKAMYYAIDDSISKRVSTKELMAKMAKVLR